MEKLVRNTPGHRIVAQGGKVRVAEPSEMPLLLARKLVEEAQEVLAVIEGTGGHERLVQELADVTEAIRGLRQVAHVRKDDLRAARRTKRAHAGDFSERLVWERD